MNQAAITLLLAVLGVQTAAPTTPPLPCTHKKLRQLEFLRDTWSVSGNWLGADGVMEPVRGESEFSSELGGCLIVERFRGTMNAAPFASLTLFGYNAVQEHFELVHSDSLHGSLLTFIGSAVGGVVGFEAQIHLSRTITLRQEYRQSGQTIVVERKRRFDGSDVWTTVWTATYQKRQ